MKNSYKLAMLTYFVFVSSEVGCSCLKNTSQIRHALVFPFNPDFQVFIFPKIVHQYYYLFVFTKVDTY